MIDPDKIFGRLGNRMFQGVYIISQMDKGLIPNIYVQDYRLFEDSKEKIKQMFGSDIGFFPYVSIHFRKGDYVNNPYYVDLSKTNYYTDAIALFPNDKFLVFSDDIEAAKEFFKGDRFEFSDTKDEIQDLNGMASCHHHIIANSSFSFWGAYLGSNPGRKVVAPSIKNWYTDGVERTICPPEWIRL